MGCLVNSSVWVQNFFLSQAPNKAVVWFYLKISSPAGALPSYSRQTRLWWQISGRVSMPISNSRYSTKLINIMIKVVSQGFRQSLRFLLGLSIVRSIFLELCVWLLSLNFISSFRILEVSESVMSIYWTIYHVRTLSLPAVERSTSSTAIVNPYDTLGVLENKRDVWRDAG